MFKKDDDPVLKILIIVVVVVVLAITITTSFCSGGGGGGSHEREWGNCRVCGKETTLYRANKGYYCIKHDPMSPFN